ncbi:aminotransferase [Spirochaetia bacterium]|nr:aminotransferase [Spirochaetia bacterium]
MPINKNIYVTLPTLAPLNMVMELLEGVWSRGIMTHNGPLVQQFENEVAAFLGIKNIVAVANGTIAIQMAIRALELKGEIITTPFTFIATISSIIWEGCMPVFVDIDPETLNIDPEKIEKKINKHTCAILPVHVFGNCSNIEAIDAIAKRHHLKVIYDAAHSVGVQYKGKSVFEYGDISVTSFHATKMLNTAEGGACFTLNDAIHEKLRSIRFFGFDKDHKEIIDDGFNGKMTEVHAAVGLANIKLLNSALKDRKQKYALYKDFLSQNSVLKFQKIHEDCNYSYFPVIFPSESCLLDVEKALNQKRIYPRRYFYPSVNTFTHILPYVEMPASEDVAKRVLCLPLYYSLGNDDIKNISKIVLDTLK